MVGDGRGARPADTPATLPHSSPRVAARQQNAHDQVLAVGAALAEGLARLQLLVHGQRARRLQRMLLRRKRDADLAAAGVGRIDRGTRGRAG